MATTSKARKDQETEQSARASSSRRCSAPTQTPLFQPSSEPAQRQLLASESLGWWLLKQPVLVRVLLGGLLLGAAALTHYVFEGPVWLRVALLATSFLCTIPEIGRDALKTLFVEWRIAIDTLMFLAAFGAMALGHWEEGGLLLFLFALGREGERLAMRRAQSAIRSLGEVTPETGMRIDDDGEVREVPIEELKPGDHVRILPFERVPADADILTGSSELDQSAITGESIPVEKGPGDSVFAGTMNTGGALTARVTKTAEQSTIGRILKLIEEAQQSRSPTQRFTEQFEKIYVPLIILATAALITIPPWLGAEGGFREWFYRAMAFLTAAAPCALAIGTPAAILCGIARSARTGILIKGGAYLEALGTLNALAFDKTGTLTVGKPQVVEIAPVNGAEETEILRLAAAVEAGSSHPLADAVVNAARERGVEVPEASDVQQISGRGASGRVEGREVVVGRSEHVREAVREESWRSAQARIEQMRQARYTLIYVAIDGDLVALFGIRDKLRAASPETLRILKRLGVKQRILLTGDTRDSAEPITHDVDLDAWHADLLPEEKVAKVRELRERYRTVAMIGDGVNDAPALADATVGIAMGGAGQDIAMETADVVLMADAIETVPQAIAISRYTRRIIVENLVIALGTIVLLAPSAALGFVPLGVAVLFHEGSTLLVVLNALRILGYNPVHALEKAAPERHPPERHP